MWQWEQRGVTPGPRSHPWTHFWGEMGYLNGTFRVEKRFVPSVVTAEKMQFWDIFTAVEVKLFLTLSHGWMWSFVPPWLVLGPVWNQNFPVLHPKKNPKNPKLGSKESTRRDSTTQRAQGGHNRVRQAALGWNTPKINPPEGLRTLSVSQPHQEGMETQRKLI